MPTQLRQRLGSTLLGLATALGCRPESLSLGDWNTTGAEDSHGDAGAPGSTADPGPSGSGDDSGTGAVDCEAMAQALDLMPDIEVAWVLEGSSLLLQLGSRGFDCGADIRDEFYDFPSCPELWAFEVNVPASVLETRTRTLVPDDEGNLVYLERGNGSSGCARQFVRSSARGFDGDLIIHHVDEQCIVGQFRNLAFPTGDVPDLSGAFAAERCTN